MSMTERVFKVTSEHDLQKGTVVPVSSDGGIDVYRVNIEFSVGQPIEPVTIEWEEDMVNILHVWHPTGGTNRAVRQVFNRTQNLSNFCFGAPVLCTIGEHGMNSETVAVSDVNVPIYIRFWVKDLEQRDKVAYQVEFFPGMSGTTTSYTADIRIDTRELPYYESIPSVSAWWREYGYVIPKCPEASEDALYSSWYNFHQAPDDERLIKDLKIASEMGFRTVILDDGWQFEGPSSGNYSQCGDWKIAKDKFSDFKAFVDEVHALDMKLIVWFCVPFIGYDAEAYETYRGKYLYDVDDSWGRCSVLDPRYPEVREFLKNTYKDFLIKYDIDGFKLDFIDSFRQDSSTAPYNEAMDCESVVDAVLILMKEIKEELDTVKPDLLYEYRQNYVGPAINQYGNMLRVADCAYDSLTNRIGVMDLRLLDYPVAVHSDMLFWSKDERLSLCAKQLLNIFFSVPQISVILDDSTKEQRALLKHYLDYWTENRDLILHGKFRPLHPELNYSVVSAENEEKMITVLYADLPCVYPGKACDILHNGDLDGLIFENPSESVLEAQIYDCLGNLLERKEIPANTIVRLQVPKTGMLCVK